MKEIQDNELWLVHIECFKIEWDNIISPIYEYFDDKHYLFRDNETAVNFIRKKAEKNKLQGVWTEIDWDENGEEYCSYLAFKDEFENEIDVFFDLTEIK